MVNQHFLKRNRLGRLTKLLERHPDLIGFGIDEETALVVGVRDQQISVVGDSYIVACLPASKDRPARFQILKEGDQTDLAALRKPTPPSSPRSTSERSPPPSTGSGVPLSILESPGDMRGNQETRVVLKGLPMPTLTIEYHDEDERLALEQAIAYLERSASSRRRRPRRHRTRRLRESRPREGPGPAPLDPRRRLAQPRRSGRAKRGDARTYPEAHPGHSKGPHPRTILTAVGPVTLVRRYFACPACDQGDFGADRILGVDGYVTRGACRMAFLLGIQQSFQKAELALLEVAGWELDDNTLRQFCHATAVEAPPTRERRATAEAFAQAEGHLEVHIDAGKINTLEAGVRVRGSLESRRRSHGPTWSSDILPYLRGGRSTDRLVSASLSRLSSRRGFILTSNPPLNRSRRRGRSLAARSRL